MWELEIVRNFRVRMGKSYVRFFHTRIYRCRHTRTRTTNRMNHRLRISYWCLDHYRMLWLLLSSSSPLCHLVVYSCHGVTRSMLYLQWLRDDCWEITFSTWERTSSYLVAMVCRTSDLISRRTWIHAWEGSRSELRWFEFLGQYWDSKCE